MAPCRSLTPGPPKGCRPGKTALVYSVWPLPLCIVLSDKKPNI